MEIILICCTIFYCIYLNLKVKDVENDTENLILDIAELDIKLYNKMMDVRRDIINEKSRRKPTKKRGRLSKNAISKSKILRKSRGDKDIL